MLVIEYNPETGWSAPIIKPYGPISLDPASSVFQYATAAFEGMKAFRGEDGRPRLFRPEMNMDRMQRSAERVALPVSTSSFLGFVLMPDAIDPAIGLQCRRCAAAHQEAGRGRGSMDPFNTWLRPLYSTYLYRNASR